MSVPPPPGRGGRPDAPSEGAEEAETMELIVSDGWRRAYPDAAVGILAMHGVANPAHHPGLEQRKRALERALRERYAGYDRQALKALPALQAYDAYYRQFRKTYHVQLQLESVVFKDKPIPSVAAIVEMMFMAELHDLLLTAVHDLEAVEFPVRVDVADGSERYVRLDGQEQRLKAGDMFIADRKAVMSSIIYGPDRRTQVTDETRAVLFTTYAPPGIAPEIVQDHLEGILEMVHLVAPGATVETLRVYRASPAAESGHPRPGGAAEA
jgi:DNA/RNA-binding domain of Phe-tRNA-synthetase-like protein